MANINKVKIDNTWYDIEDATARSKKTLYFTAQTVSVATNAQMMRIPANGTNSSITTDTIVLNCEFANPENVDGSVSWTSYDGYVTVTGTCTSATTANVVLGTKSN